MNEMGDMKKRARRFNDEEMNGQMNNMKGENTNTK